MTGSVNFAFEKLFGKLRLVVVLDLVMLKLGHFVLDIEMTNASKV
jgi:hypothetical protein